MLKRKGHTRTAWREKSILFKKWSFPGSFVCLVPVHLFLSCMALLYHVNREREEQRQRQLRKRHLKSEAALLQTLPRLLHLVQFVKSWKFFLELNSKRLYQSSESCFLVFTSSTKREILHFHVIDVQWRQINVGKSVMHVQGCCFVNLNLGLLLFCCFVDVSVVVA